MSTKSLVRIIVLVGLAALALFAVLFWLLAEAPGNADTSVVTLEVISTATAVSDAATPSPTEAVTATIAPPPTSTPAAPFYYVVAEGDSITGIAARFNVSVDAIVALNNISADVIFAGQTLIIPAGGASGSDDPALGAHEYRVAAGDSLESIAETQNTTLQRLRAANFMYGDSILPGQVLNLPDKNTPALAFSWSVLDGNRTLGYPIFYEDGDFTLRYQADSFTAVDPEAVAGLVRNALANTELLWGRELNGSFIAYAAGTLFEPENQHLRGRSFSANRETLFLYDGTGDPADQQYIIAHELTHLYMWNVFGVPSSVMISEGAAVYSGMSAISGSDHLPLKSICKLLFDADALPDVAADLGYSGHNYDLANYYTAGCFVQFLAETYNPLSIGLVYPNSDYANVFGKKLAALEQDFELWLSWQPEVAGVDAAAFSTQLDAVSHAYRNFFPAFMPTSENLEKYRLLDHARLELLKGSLAVSAEYLAQFQGN